MNSLEKYTLITGGTEGIGLELAKLFALDKHNLIIVARDGEKLKDVKEKIEEEFNVKVEIISADLSVDNSCEKIYEFVDKKNLTVDNLINNAGVQFPQNNINCISQEQLELTFKINIFSMFYITQEALKYMKRGSTIVNTTSVTAYQGKENLIDYSSTKGAVVTFTRSLSQSLAKHGIRVNAVAPGPIWTPLIVSSFSEEEVARFGSDVPMKRAGQPFELAPAYVYLASDDSSYVTGQVLHVNGGTMVDS